MIETKTGDATLPRPDGNKGVIIAHICNTNGSWGAGFVIALNKLSPVAKAAYLALAHYHRPPLRISFIPIGTLQFVEALPNLFVANMVVQAGTNSYDSTGEQRPQKVNVDGGPSENLVDYAALEKCLIEVFRRALVLECDVHIPAGMGSGLAGGDKAKIHDIIRTAYVYNVDTLDRILSVTLWEFADKSAASFVSSQPPVAQGE